MPLVDPPPPRAELVAEGDGLRVDLAGDLDLVARPILNDVLEKITAAPPTSVMVVLSQVTFLSSDALSFLAQVRQHASRGDFAVTLAGPTGPTLRALEVSGFTKAFAIVAAP